MTRLPRRVRVFRARHILNRQRHPNGLSVKDTYDVPDDTDHIKRCGCGRIVAVKILNVWREADDLDEMESA